MFDFLKKKVKSFTEKVKQAIEKKPEKKSAISETKVLEKEKIPAKAIGREEKKLFETPDYFLASFAHTQPQPRLKLLMD